MLLAQRYRRKFAAQRGDRVLGYLALAAILHLGVGIGVLARWHPQLITPVVDPETVQPIEFVYLDRPDSAPPLESERLSSVDAIAGGAVDPELPVSAGKPEEGAIATPANKPVTPIASVPQAYSPVISPSAAQPKAVESEPTEKPEDASVRALGTEAIATPENPQPLPPPQPPIPNADLPTVRVSPPPFPAAATPDPAPLPPTEGVGLGGTFNPDQSEIGEMGLNVQEDPIWGEYFAELNQQIDQHWQNIPLDRRRTAMVRFRIDRQGQLIELELTESSGLPQADQSALNAVRLAAPFPPFPSSTTELERTRTIQFEYNLININ